MGFLTRLDQQRRRAELSSSAQLQDLDWVDSRFLGGGGYVTADLALTIPPFWKAIRILSENIASFQLSVYERMTRGNKKAPTHPHDYTIGRAANPDLTGFEFGKPPSCT